jgi:hypothetical protein
MRRLIVAAVLSAFFAVPALAGGCPGLMAKVDEALAAGPQLTTAQLAEVGRLRAEGEAAHAAGNHARSMELLQQAMAILGIE